MVLRRLLIVFTALIMGQALILFSYYTHENGNFYEMPDNSSGPLQEGIFTGSGMGFVGEVELEVHFLRESPDSHPLIGQIRTLQSDEVREYWNRVIKELKPQVIDRQSTDIDTLTGATESSRAFLEAVENAMDKAYETK